MIGINVEKNNNSGDKIIRETKINTNNNIYSKIAPPNTFKRRNTNQMIKKPKIIQRYENIPQTNQINSLYINNNSNRTSLKSNNNTLVLKPNTDIKISQNVNSSFIEKIKLVKGSLFNNSNIIISPKKITLDKMKNKNTNNNRGIDNKNIILKPNVYMVKKHNSVYTKSDKINNLMQKDEKKNEKNVIKDNNFSKDNLDIKEKYDFLLDKTRNLLFNYQKIVEYYQNKDKDKDNEKDTVKENNEKINESIKDKLKDNS